LTIDRLFRGSLEIGEGHENDDDDTRTTMAALLLLMGGTRKAGTHIFILFKHFSFHPLHHAYSQEGHWRGWTALFLVER
jgi:hypothetical protein